MVLTFIQKNWFALGACLFSAIAFITQTHASASQVADLAAAYPRLDSRVQALEQAMAERSQALEQMSEDVRAMRAESEKQARSVAALCQATGARCAD